MIKIRRFKEDWRHGFLFGEDYIEIFVNPTTKELISAGSGARGYITEEGNLFIWDGKIIHAQALIELDKELGSYSDYLKDYTKEKYELGIPITRIKNTNKFTYEFKNITKKMKNKINKAKKKNPLLKIFL